MNRRRFLAALGFAGIGGRLGTSEASAQQVGDLLKLGGVHLKGTAHRVVWGRNGVVSTADMHGSLAGLRMLLRGGNAIDAVVAAAAALNVAEPYMSGLGGFGGFMLIYLAAPRTVVGLDMMGTSPAASSMETMTEKDFGGYRSPIVPGALMGWTEALSRYGTMSLGDVFEPAIELAERGWVVSDYDARAIAARAHGLARFPTSARIFLPNGEPPRMGQVVRQKDLARSFRRIALEGPDIFYKGAMAREIVNFLQQHGGLLTEEDLASYRVRWREPIKTTFHGHTLYVMPPGSCGMTMLQALNIMEGFPLEEMEPYSTEFAHLWLEAMKLALADDDRYNTGKDVKIPVRRLISKEYAAQQRDKIDPRRAAAFPGPPFPMEGTTSLATADRWGNAVVFTQSLSGGFGSGVVAGDTGIFLNNGHSFGFVLDPDHVNSLEGGARAKGVMTPALVLRDDRLLMGVGAAGGYTIPQTVGQVITKALVYRMDIQRAIASPRMVINRGGGRAPAPGDSHTYLEAGFPENVYAELGALGHTLVPPGNAGGVQGVYVDPETGTLAGGADPRRDGHALAW